MMMELDIAYTKRSSYKTKIELQKEWAYNLFSARAAEVRPEFKLHTRNPEIYDILSLKQAALDRDTETKSFVW